MSAANAPSPGGEKPVDAQAAQAGKADLREAYQTVADVAGGVPSLRWKDNLYQAAAVAAFVLLGALVGALVVFFQSSGPHRAMEALMGAAAGGFVGLIVGALASGFVLAILGIKRVATKK